MSDGGRSSRSDIEHETVETRQELCWRRLEPCDVACQPWPTSHHRALLVDQSAWFVGGEAPRREVLGLQLPGVNPPSPLRWLAAPTQLPERLQKCSAVLLDRQLVIFGGLCQGEGRSDGAALHVFDTVAKRWQAPRMPQVADKREKEDVPETRYEHVAWSVGRAMIVHGGRTLKRPRPLDHVFRLTLRSNTARWCRLRLNEDRRDHHAHVATQNQRRTLARRCHSVVFANNRALLFGGRREGQDASTEGSICNDLTQLEVAGAAEFVLRTEVPRGRAPEARVYHSAVHVGSFMVIFGGMSRKAVVLCDVHLLHIASLVWVTVVNPHDVAPPGPWPDARWGHAAVAVSRPEAQGGDMMYVFGGTDAAGGCLGDVYSMCFQEPVLSSGAGAGCAIEALGLCPDSLLLSLWDRLYTNLQVLERRHAEELGQIQGDIAEWESKAYELQNQKALEEQRVAEAQKRLADLEAEEQSLLARIEEKERGAEASRTAAAASIEAAAARAAALGQQCERLQSVQSLLEEAEVDALEAGAVRGGAVRAAALWRGSLVTVERVERAGACTCIEPMRRELRLCLRLRHPNLVEYFGPTSLIGAVISEPPLTPLQSLRLDPRFTTEAKLRVGLDLALALEYLHLRGVAHRDVALEQLYVTECLATKLGGLLVARARSTEADDPRGLDMHAFGALLAPLMSDQWQGPVDYTASLSGKDQGRAIAKIDHAALRLVAMKCMEKDPRHRMSACVAARAMRRIERGELVVRVDAIPDDPSKEGPLAEGTAEALRIWRQGAAP